jgi:murein DD-endopeptidase MepM/ murein hydrolase activator NlpD
MAALVPRFRPAPRALIAVLVLAPALAAGLLCGPLCAPAQALRWARPVLGPLTRGFDVHGSPFAAGLHRGVDLEVPRGAAVGAPCSGRIVAAGRIGVSGRVVTVACGPWHATVMPLASVAVRRGAHVRAGRPVGTAAGARGGHAGLHFGVRRARERFGYVDPLRFMPAPHPWTPVGPRGQRDRPRRAPAPRPVTAPRPVAAPRPLARPRPVARPRSDPARPPLVRPATAAARRPVAPWPVWAGVALLLAGASTGGLVRRARRSREARARHTGRRASRTSIPAG